ncbi:hypothetical protein CMV_014300 [Castanea mollissima]|uniref:DUF4283 domain-containing protein n=1 Tax=Castanea mollissima TaxID=60419 RepID=A0A8J4QXX6_9ROSI|nr:hypothetical protein CMV_014300 [Castanea mollissima]
MKLWKPSGRVDMVDLRQDFFLLRFLAQEDLELVLRKGMWFVSEHFLSIRKWEANFKPSEAQVTSVAAWVRLNKLPIEYYDTIVLRQIGQALGKVLRIDIHMASEARGRYARICVQVDIAKPLINTVRVEKRNHLVSCEGVSKLCFSCGRLRHRKEICQYTVRSPAPPPEDSLVQNDKDKSVHQPTFPAHSEDQGKAVIESTEASFGPWVNSGNAKGDLQGDKSSANPLLGLGLVKDTQGMEIGVPIDLAEEEQLQVRDVLRRDGWDWSDISLQIPEEILMEIRAIPYSITAPNVGDRSRMVRIRVILILNPHTIWPWVSRMELINLLGGEYGKLRPCRELNPFYGNACIIVLELESV